MLLKFHKFYSKTLFITVANFGPSSKLNTKLFPEIVDCLFNYFQKKPYPKCLTVSCDPERGGCRKSLRYKIKFFVAITCGFQSLHIVPRSSILDVAGVLGSPLRFTIFQCRQQYHFPANIWLFHCVRIQCLIEILFLRGYQRARDDLS